ncbi:MAG TPA: hypothetical protein VIF57_17610 [Polyangia bacterium]|jgi:hypothetical protein
MPVHLFVAVALALAAGTAPADRPAAKAPSPEQQADVDRITDEMNAVNRAGKPKGAVSPEFCARLEKLWKEGRSVADVGSDAFVLARKTLRQNGSEWGCPSFKKAARSGDNTRTSDRRSLWDIFVATRKSLEDPTTPEERTRRQEALLGAALSLIHTLSPGADRYQDVVDGLALAVVPKDKVAALQAIVGSVAPKDLQGDKGKVIAQAVAKLATDIPPNALEKEQIDSLIDFVVKIAKERPAWLQEKSAGRFLELVLKTLGDLPPDKVSPQQAQAIFDFTATLLKRDPRWLDGARSTMLAELVPRLLERLDVSKVKSADLGVLLEFTAKVMAGRPDWPDDVRRLIDDWDKILQIAKETKNTTTRAIVLKAVKTLQQREGDAWKPLADEVAKADPDPQMVTALLQALGVSKVEQIRRAQAALANQEIVQATYLQLGTLVGLRLPAGCHDAKRDGAPACAAVLDFADRFRKHVVAGAREGADFGPEIDTEMKDALSRAECTLLPPDPDPRKPLCQPIAPSGTFASFVGLEITRHEAPGGDRLTATAGCVVVSPGRKADRVEQVGVVEFGAGADASAAVTVAAEALATKVLDRCPLSKPYSDFATELLAKGNVAPDVNASSALVFAGLPYLRDPRVSPGLARGISAADFLTLLAGGGALVGGIYMHNTSDGPWGDRLLRGGLISLGVNILIKLGATAYYAARYPRREAR